MPTPERQPAMVRIHDPDPSLLSPGVRALFAAAGLRVKAFYRVHEVATFFGVSVRQVYYMIDDGRLSPVGFRETMHPRGGIRPTLIPITTLLDLLPPTLSR